MAMDSPFRRRPIDQPDETGRREAQTPPQSDPAGDIRQDHLERMARRAALAERREVSPDARPISTYVRPPVPLGPHGPTPLQLDHAAGVVMRLDTYGNRWIQTHQSSLLAEQIERPERVQYYVTAVQKAVDDAADFGQTEESKELSSALATLSFDERFRGLTDHSFEPTPPPPGFTRLPHEDPMLAAAASLVISHGDDRAVSHAQAGYLASQMGFSNSVAKIKTGIQKAFDQFADSGDPRSAKDLTSALNVLAKYPQFAPLNSHNFAVATPAQSLDSGGSGLV